LQTIQQLYILRRLSFALRLFAKKILAWIIHEICSKLKLDINFKTVTITR